MLSLSPLCAQQTLEVKRVSSDELVEFIRREVFAEIYFIKDPEDVATYSVSAPRETFLKMALDELRDKGYAVSAFDGKYIVMSRPGIATDIPSGFFDSGQSSSSNDELLKYISDQNAIASFQNKVYEIGDPVEGRTGNAYVTGYVRDISNGEPLVGISVYDDKSGAYAQTDAYGFYRVHLPVGEDVLNFSGYSLEDMHLNVIIYDDGGLDVVMKEKVTSLKGAVVSAESVSRHRDAKMGLERVRMNTIKKIPTAFGESDVLKVVLSLPGVKSVGEASSGFNVRGGAADQNLILFNDGTIYNPSHMFGIFSAFNTDVINDIELYKSSIPAELGGRISSVLDIHGKEGNSNKVAGTLGIGMLTSSFSLEGPLVKGRTTFVLGGRTTYSNWMLNLLPEDSGYSGGRASFSDLNAGVTHHVNDRNTIHAYAYWSRDKFSFAADTTFHYSNLNASLKWRSVFSDKHSMSATVGYDSYRNSLDNTYYDVGYSLSTQIQQAFLKLSFNSMLNASQTLSYGFDGLMYNLNPGCTEALEAGSVYVPSSLALQRAVEGALFLSDEWKAGEKLVLEGGARLSMFQALNPSRFYLHPEVRISGKYSFQDNLSLKAGFNSMTQYIHMISNTTNISPMDTWQLSSSAVRPQTGWQAAGGLYWTVGDNKYDLSVEGYYKRMFHYLDYKSGAVLTMNPNLADDLVQTTGKAYGVEFMIKKTLGKLNGWLAYTWSRTLLREMEDRGVATINGGDWYSAAHDKPHDFKMVANYKFTHRYSLSVNVDYSSGRPVTIPIGKYYYKDGYRLAYSERNGYRIPDYFRMDIAMNIDPGHYLKQLTHMSFTFGVYNVTGRKNPYSVYYSSDGVDVKGYMLCVFATPVPYANLNIKF